MKTCVITGATGGIGRYIALGMAQAGYRVILVGRDAARGEAAKAWIAGQVQNAALEVLTADLASLAATAALSRQIAAAAPALDALILNAGIFLHRREETAEGHEKVLAVNHLSPFALIRALEAPLRAAGGRVVTIGSSSSDRAGIDPRNLELQRNWGMVRAYSQSKLAVMIATFGWAARLREAGITANVVHPGLVATSLVRTPGIIGLAWRLMAPFSRTAIQGAETPLYAALSPDLAGVTGVYLKDKKTARPNPLALQADLAARVWQATERLIEPTPPDPPRPTAPSQPVAAPGDGQTKPVV